MDQRVSVLTCSTPVSVDADPGSPDFDYRKNPLIEAVISRDPDVVCLQNVDKYDEYLRLALKVHGYESAYRTTDRQGVMIAHKSDRWKLKLERRGTILVDHIGTYALSLLENREGKYVLVYTVLFDERSTTIRSRECDRLLDIVRDNPGYPIVITTPGKIQSPNCRYSGTNQIRYNDGLRSGGELLLSDTMSYSELYC